MKSQPVVNTYPSMDEFQSIDKCVEYIPPSLRTLLKIMFASKKRDKKIAFIGQSIMQQIRPRSSLVPLQLAVSVVMHHQFASRFLIDMINAMGFGSSYNEVSKFERNAAVSQGTTIVDKIDDSSFIQFVADNVDHNIRTLDGLNTFHGMGMIASVTPYINYPPSPTIKYTESMVPRLTVSAEDICKVGEIERQFFSKHRKVCKQSKFQKLKSMKSCDPTKAFGDLWRYAWLLKPQRPMWNGFMQMIHTKRVNHL